MDDIKSLVTRFYDTWNTHDRTALKFLELCPISGDSIS
jgi:hypothetical protein